MIGWFAERKHPRPGPGEQIPGAAGAQIPGAAGAWIPGAAGAWMRCPMKLALAVSLALLFLAPAAQADRAAAAALRGQGDLLLKRGQTDEAEKVYRKAIVADPRYGPAWGSLALYYLRQQRFAETDRLLSAAVKTLPRYYEGWYHLAYARRKLGKLDGAIAAYRTYAKLRPETADPHYGLGLALAAKGEHAAAAASFRRYALLENAPAKRSWVKKALALAVAQDGRARDKSSPKTAVAAAPRASKVKAPAREEQVAVPRLNEAPRKAAPVESKPLTAERKAALADKRRGDKLAKEQRYEAAIDAYRAAIAKDYTFLAAYNEQATTLFALKRYGEAIRVFRIAIRDNPSYDLGWYNLAYALRKARRYAEAIQAYRKFADKHPRDPDPHYGLGLTYQAKGDKAQAIASFNAYIKLEGRPTQVKWIARASKVVRSLGGTPAQPLSTPSDKSGTTKTEAAVLAQAGAGKTQAGKGAADGGGKTAAAAGSGGKAIALPADVLAKALAATGKGGAPPVAEKTDKPLTKRERAKLAREEKARKRREALAARRAAAKRRREEAAQKRAEARQALAERRRKAKLDREAKREMARLARAEKLRQRKEAAARRREEARERRLAAKAAKAGKAGKAGKADKAVAKAPTDASPAVGAVALVAPKVAPEPDRPASIPPPPRPTGTGSDAGSKLRVQGDTLARVGKCTNALPLYRRALRVDPFGVAAYDGLAHCAQRTRSYALGIKALSMGLRDNPGYTRGWLHLARLRDTAGDQTGAVGTYRKYLRKQPRDLDARFELARALRHVGQKGPAIAAYRGYLKADRRPERRARQAAAFAELRELGGAPPLVAAVAWGASKAGTSATSSAGAKPTATATKLPADVFARALAAAKGGQAAATVEPPKALSAKERRRRAAAQRAEDRRLAREERARKAREKREARKQARAERARKLAQAREDRRLARVDKLRKAREARLAKRAAAKAARQRRLDRIREDRMLARLAREKKTAKGRRGRKARAGGPLAAGTGMARTLDRDLDGAGAAAAVPEVELSDRLKPAPDAARGLMQVADKQFAKRRYVVALGIYQQAARLDTSASEPLYKAGVVAVALGRMHLAAELFDRVLQIDPGNATARTNLRMAQAASQGKAPSAAYLASVLSAAKADLSAGHYAQAERKLSTLAKRATSGQLYRLRAQARLGLRRSQAALIDAGRALALAPANAAALRLLGDAQRQLKRNKKAIYYYRLFLARTEGDTRQAAVRKTVEAAVAELASAN